MRKSTLLILLAVASTSTAAEGVKIGDTQDTPNHSVSVQTGEQSGVEVTGIEPPKASNHPVQGSATSDVPALDENLKELKSLFGGRSACSNSSTKFSSSDPDK